MKGEGGGSRLGWTPDPGPAPPRPPAPGPFSSWWWWSFLVVVVVVVVVWGSPLGTPFQPEWAIYSNILGGRFGPQPPPPPTIILYWIGSPPQGPQIRQNRKPNTNTNIYLRYHHIGWGEVGEDVRRGSKKAGGEVLGPERCRLPRPQFCQRYVTARRTPTQKNPKDR